MRNNFRIFKILAANAVAMGFLSTMLVSCGSTRDLIYMQGKFDSARLSQIKVSEPIIRKGDLMSIIVFSDNPQATALYNQSLIVVNTNSSSSSSGGNSGSTGGTQSSGSVTAPGYLVDAKGEVQLQGIGGLHVEGLTVSQLKDSLNARLKGQLMNPYYSIRFLNYRFTMLGEVNRPGIFSIPGEHVSLLEAIGMAGDLTFYGRRDNVLVMRDSVGKRQWARLDLKSPEIMASPYFYLQQNDVVIVEPTRKRVGASDITTARNITIAATIVSTIAIIYSIFRN